MAAPPSFTRWLRDGERIVWAAAAVTPLQLRRLGIPPRTTTQLLLHGFGLTCHATSLVFGVTASGLDPWVRAALIVGGVLPPLILGAWALVPTRRAYAFTDGGRGFARHGKTVVAFPASATPQVRMDADREAGDLAFGELDVEVLAGPRTGHQAGWDICLYDVPYPDAVLEILSEVLPVAS